MYNNPENLLERKDTRDVPKLNFFHLHTATVWPYILFSTSLHRDFEHHNLLGFFKNKVVIESTLCPDC